MIRLTVTVRLRAFALLLFLMPPLLLGATGAKASTAPSVGLTSSVNPSSPGQSVTFTATVTPVAPAPGTPSGTVTFLDGTTTLGTGPVTLDANGQATYTTSSLSPGLHVITASYGGDTSFNSASGLLNQLVSRAWTVSAWGYNENGELGNGGTTNSDVPVPVSSLRTCSNSS